MTPTLLFLPGAVVAGFALLFVTTLLERLVAPRGSARVTPTPAVVKSRSPVAVGSRRLALRSALATQG